MSVTRRWDCRCPACHGEGKISVCNCCGRKYESYFDEPPCYHYQGDHEDECPVCHGYGYTHRDLSRAIDLPELEFEDDDNLYTLTKALDSGWVWRIEGEDDETHWERNLKMALECLPAEVAANFEERLKQVRGFVFE